MRYFTSDTHFGHERIIALCNRPFRDVDHMNESLVANWNSIVQPEDIVYHLGDVALGPREAWDDVLDRLNGRIVLIPGNHDRCSPSVERRAWKVTEQTEQYSKWFTVRDEVELLNISNPVTNGDNVVEVVLSHYPFAGEPDDGRGHGRVFNGQPFDIGKPLIHGHTHSTERESHSEHGTPMLHIGMDAWDYHPVPETEVIEWLAREHLL